MSKDRRPSVGMPLRIMERLRPRLVSRLESLLRNRAGCWVWNGYRDDDGYGQVWYAGRAHWAHRVAFALFVRPLKWGETVHHRCLNESCCNPSHLEALPIEAHNNLWREAA